jgi:pimeloyl-ACP methyl ester carboxylesterase
VTRRRLLLVTLLLASLAACIAYVVEPNRAALHVLLRMESDESALASFAAWGRPAVTSSDELVVGTRSRAYRPAGRAKAVIVLLHGMHRLGIDEPRLVALARAVAETGFAVHTPELTQLAAYRLEEAEAERLGEIIGELATREQAPRVGVFGISFAGGLALLAASDPDVSARVAAICALGSYGDLVRVTRFYAGEDARSPSGAVPNITPHPYGIEILLRDALEHWAPEELREALGEVLRLSLHDAFREADELAKSLEAPWDARMRALLRGRPDSLLQTAALAHVARNEAALRAASPEGKLGVIDRPVFLLHGIDDPVIPATESEHLAAELGGRATLLVSKALRHAESAREAPMTDKLALLRFMTRYMTSL